MNLGQAREQIVTMLDDPDGQRWALPAPAVPPAPDFDPSNEVDLALQSAAVECVSLYAHSGGDFFDVVQEVQTTNGTFSFTAGTTPPNVPLFIKAVSLKDGRNNYRLHATREQDIEVDVDTSRGLRVRMVYVPDFSGLNVGDELTYSGSVGATLSWSMFDQWVLSVAAQHLTPKENVANAQLDQRIAMLQNSCLKAPEMPTTVTFPGPRNSNYSVDAALYRWSYVARDAIANQTCCLRIHRVSLRAW